MEAYKWHDTYGCPSKNMDTHRHSHTLTQPYSNNTVYHMIVSNYAAMEQWNRGAYTYHSIGLVSTSEPFGIIQSDFAKP